MYSGPGSGVPISIAHGSWTQENGISSWTPNLEISRTEHAFKIHRQACKLHEEGTVTCYGSLRRRQNSSCMKKATSFPDRVMPTCKLHQDQIIQASRCKVPLSCGRYCGRLCEWIPHSLQRCSIHYDHPMPCYFLKIPLELRTRIYDMLLPNQDVRAIQGPGTLRADGKPCQPAILRVNQQIHDEATTFMYSVNTFIVNLSQQGLSMCNGRVIHGNQNSSMGGNHALQDYQMQLMLLEQQNKRRLMLARQQQHAGQSSSQPPPPQNATQGFFINHSQAGPSNVQIQTNYYNPGNFVQAEIQPLDRIWTSPLSPRYFNLIRSFRIEIYFPTTMTPNGRTPEQDPQRQSQQLYSLNDQLHRLISRFELTHRPLTRLEINFNLVDAYPSLEEAVSATDVLLRPFRRLYGIGNASVRSITMKNPVRYQAQYPGTDDIDLLTPDAAHTNANLLEYLHSFSLALRSPTPSLPLSSLFDGYWKLSILLDKIKVHCSIFAIKGDQEVRSGLVGFENLKHRARVAREDGDEKGFREVFEKVLDTWQRYMMWEKEFQRDTWGDIEGIWGVFGDGGR